MEHISQAIQGLTASKTTTAACGDWAPKLDAYEPSLVRARDECSRLIADMQANPELGRWITLSGPNGCGKSMLAEQTGAKACDLNPDRQGALVFYQAGEPRPRRRVRWMDERKLADRLRHGDYHLKSELSNEFLLVIDELGGTRDPSAFLADALAEILQDRLGKWTIITTNLTLSEIQARMDGRIASRLHRDDNRWITIEAGDYALRRPKTHPGAS